MGYFIANLSLNLRAKNVSKSANIRQSYRLPYGLADVTATHCRSLASIKSTLVLPFWYLLTLVVPEKGPLNGCVCVCVAFAYTTWPLRAKMTSSTKTEVRNTLQRCPRRTKPRPHIKKFGEDWIMCSPEMLPDKQTYTQTYIHAHHSSLHLDLCAAH